MILNDFTSLNLLGTQRLIQSHLSQKATNYVYHNYVTLLKIALSFFCTQLEIVRAEKVFFLWTRFLLWDIIKSCNSKKLSPPKEQHTIFKAEVGLIFSISNCFIYKSPREGIVSVVQQQLFGFFKNILPFATHSFYQELYYD